MIKRIYFFKASSYDGYDPRPGTDRVVSGGGISAAWAGLDASFGSGVNAAVNWGDGFVYLFKADKYWKYNVLTDRAETPDSTFINVGWPDLPAAFKLGIDAAFNGGNGKAYFFKADEYLRYNIADDRVDDPDPGTAPYPRKITDPNGWKGLPVPFQSGIDAAVNTGNGKIYFFKGPDYVRLTFDTRTVDPGFGPPTGPPAISSSWSGLFSSDLDDGLEWSHAGGSTLNVPVAPSGCITVPGPGGTRIMGEQFRIEADFTHAEYPTLCGCAEYRQLVRGSFMRNGLPQIHQLANPSGVGSIPLDPVNFNEDGLFPAPATGTNVFYGHRSEGSTDPSDAYSNPDRRSGCTYRGSDFPKAGGNIGDNIAIQLDFRGVIIDHCAADEELVSQSWSVNCSGVLT